MSNQWDDEPTVVWSPPEWVVEEEDMPKAGAATRIQFSEPEPSPPPPGPMERPDIEMDIRTVNGPSALASIRRVYEVWTKNRVYVLDSGLRCIEVIDLATGVANKEHPFIGARCAGGRNHSKSELSFPLPAPGSEAVFQKAESSQRVKLSVTSKVVRVMLHASRVRIQQDQADRVWGKISTWG